MQANKGLTQEPTQDLNLTLVQTDLIWEDAPANRKHFDRLLAQIKQTDLVLLPEMFTTGFSMKPATFAEQPDGPTTEWMASKASALNAVVCGSLIIGESDEEGDTNYFNRLIWMEPDGSYKTYDKRHLFGMAGEDKDYAAGTDRLIAEVKGWRVCPLICYDLRFPVWSRNVIKDGRPVYDLLTYVANWPDKRIAHWSSLLRARAIENQVWLAGLNRIGSDPNGFTHKGASAIIDPHGETLFEETGKEVVETATISASALESVRKKLPFLQDGDAFHIR